VAKKAKVVLPVAPLPDLVRWWQSQKVRGVVIGGLAVSLLARPRFTRDLDGLVLLPEDQWSAFLHSASAFGFSPRDPDALEFAKISRMLLLRHEATAIDVDIAFGLAPFEEELVARAISADVAGVTVLLPTPEDLVIMKAVAHRDQDILDIDAVLIAYPRLDVARVRHWIQIFAEALDTPELSADMERRLAARPRRQPGKRKK
jgi:Nucleotidyltransferase of unknown function (DUF6036)